MDVRDSIRPNGQRPWPPKNHPTGPHEGQAPGLAAASLPPSSTENNQILQIAAPQPPLIGQVGGVPQPHHPPPTASVPAVATSHWNNHNPHQPQPPPHPLPNTTLVSIVSTTSIDAATIVLSSTTQEQQEPHPVSSMAASTTVAAPAGGSSRNQTFRPHYHPGSIPLTPQQQQRPSAGGARRTFNFTLKDIDRCLFGKQEMRIVNIDDVKPPVGVGSGNNNTPVGKQNGSTTKPEDKNKPAKWCDLCQEIRFGECPEHGPLVTSQKDSISLPGPKSYAISTFPDEVGLCISTVPQAGYGVFARLCIPIGTWIGPYEGRKITAEEGMQMINQGNGNFLWEIHENSQITHFLDASDEKTSSWMRFIQCARHQGEQNLFVFQYYGSIYYRAFKDISVGEELLAWYDDKYPQYFGIPYGMADFSYLAETGQLPPLGGGGGGEGLKGGSGGPGGAEFERHYQHHGSNFIQGSPTKSKTNTGEKHRGGPDPTAKFMFGHTNTKQHPTPSHGNGPVSIKEYSLPMQPPTLSQAPPPGNELRGKSQAAGPHHAAMAHYSPRPGSASFRRNEHASNSAMLRSMSEDDLRHNKPVKHHEHHRQHPYDRATEQHPDKKGIPLHVLPPPGEHMLVRGAPHFMMHQIPQAPHGSIPHSPATSYTRLPPVMSVTALEHQQHHQHHRAKGSRDDLNKLASHAAAAVEMNGALYYERGDREKLSSAPEHVREYERMMLLHERGSHPERGTKGTRMPMYSNNMLHEHGGVPVQQHELYHHCKLCGKKFKSKLLFEGHVCEVEKHPSHVPSYHHQHHHHHAANSCSKCQITFADPREFHEHMMAHCRDNPGATGDTRERPSPYWCALCSRSFSSGANLKNHMKMHEKVQQQQLLPGSPGVTISRSPAPSAQGLLEQQQQQQQQQLIPTKDLNTTAAKLTDCMKCGKSFQKGADLLRHLNTPGECSSNPS